MLSRNELNEIVRRLRTSDGTEQELDDLAELLERNVPHPEVLELIFYPEREMTDDEIVAEAISYKPIAL